MELVRALPYGDRDEESSMMNRIRESLKARWQASSYAETLAGAEVVLPNGAIVRPKISRLVKSVRPLGYRFSPFSFHAEISLDDEEDVFSGFGEANSELLALQKALSEAVERAMIRALKRHSGVEAITTNGWSAHPSEQKSKLLACRELLERDAVLSHWLTKTPMRELEHSAIPRWVARWEDKELAQAPRWNRLRILLSTEGFAPMLTAVFQDADGFGVCSHASGTSFEDALRSALAETCRIAQVATEFAGGENRFPATASFSDAEIRAADHIYNYAHFEKFPNWLFGEEVSAPTWITQNAVIPLLKWDIYRCGGLFVSRCSGSDVQDLYFGRTEEAEKRGVLNAQRLQSVKKFGEMNFAPHIVA